MYVMQDPDGNLLAHTFAETIGDCWSNSFETVCEEFRTRGFTYRRQTGFDFRQTFWKRWQPALDCAERNGFKIVEVKLVKV